jgi:hypothetical protein
MIETALTMTAFADSVAAKLRYVYNINMYVQFQWVENWRLIPPHNLRGIR